MKYIYLLIIILSVTVSCSGNKKNSVENVIEKGNLETTGEILHLAADQVFTAIGQTLKTNASLVLEGPKIAVNGAGLTSRAGVWAGGDCASSGDDLTVTAVAEGRDAAMDIHKTLMKGA